jgi:prepilin-type N-terminal cleavage/methylation domain-containing protein
MRISVASPTKLLSTEVAKSFGVRVSRATGFTLVELMVVVAIIGVLSSIAIPAYVFNARKAKTAEAMVQIRRVYVASRAYIMDARMGRGATATMTPQFPESEPTTPAATCCGYPSFKCPPDPAHWDTPSWKALMFSVDDPHWFRYEYDSTGSGAPGTGSNFTVRAVGDMDCDGTYSTFEMWGIWSDADLDVHGSGFFQDKVTE